MGAFRLVEPGPGIVEVKFSGYLDKDILSYLPDLEAKVLSKPHLVLLYDTSDMTGFAAPVPMAHIDPFRRWLGRVSKIAVLHNSTAVALAVTTVKLASSANIKGFAKREDALAWLAALS